MSDASNSEILVWIENVQTPEDFSSVPPIVPYEDGDEGNPRAAKKHLQLKPEHDQTTSSPERIHELDDSPELSPSSPSENASHENASYETGSDEDGSHQSGRLDTVQQIQLIKDLQGGPIGFCNFDDGLEGPEPEDVRIMRSAIQRLADGMGILGYDNLDAAVSALSSVDRMRFQYPWASDLKQRCVTGSMPSMAQILGIVKIARGWDYGSSATEFEWNFKIQHPLLKLACSTSKHSQTLELFNVKRAKVEPASLARSRLHGPIIDYVVTLKPDSKMAEAWNRLRPLPSEPIKSWNHTTQARHNPIAIQIETKGPFKSWTDGKPQLAIWTDAFLKRLTLIRGTTSGLWPALPVLIVQGHDWHLLIVSKNDQEMTLWEQFDIGSTRSCFDALKVVAVLHWLMDWAESVWRPWFLSLLRT